MSETLDSGTDGVVLRLRAVGRRFGGVRAVRGVDLEVAPGERRAVIGPNGAGKTTLFNVIAGDFPPTEGSVELFGRDVTRRTTHRRARLGLARTFQAPRVLGGLTVEDNLYLALLGSGGGRFGLRPGRAERDRREAAASLARRMRLSARLADSASTLSHGEQRQLEIGMALAGEPRLLMLDEPAAGLAPGERRELGRLLLELPRDLTLLLVEHDMDIALRVADQVTVMHEGGVVAEGSPEEIRKNELVHEIYLGGQVRV